VASTSLTTCHCYFFGKGEKRTLEGALRPGEGRGGKKGRVTRCSRCDFPKYSLPCGLLEGKNGESAWGGEEKGRVIRDSSNYNSRIEGGNKGTLYTHANEERGRRQKGKRRRYYCFIRAQ